MDGPPSHPSGPGRVYTGINALFLVLVTVFVGLRFWARRLKRTFLGCDDWCILLALVIYYGQAALNFWVVDHGGLGYHAAQAGKIAEKNMLLQLTVSQFIYAVQFFVIRLSICFLFKRIFVQPWLQRTILVAIGINVAWALFVIISALGVCQPIAYNWDLTIAGGHCNNRAKLNTYIANAVWTILFDTVLWSLPQFIVWRLHMRLATKVALSTIFAIGIFDIIVSIIRITYVTRVDFSDVTYEDYNAQIWTVVEISVAIIIACLPLCRVVIEHCFPVRLFSSSARKQQQHARATKSWTHLEAQEHDGRQLQLARRRRRDGEEGGNPFGDEGVEMEAPAEGHVKGKEDVRMSALPQVVSGEDALREILGSPPAPVHHPKIGVGAGSF
ncbi:MAG: hypothetical protein Q9220_002000 [cf. Caloplaca sp. 1 TL-2023]